MSNTKSTSNIVYQFKGLVIIFFVVLYPDSWRNSYLQIERKYFRTRYGILTFFSLRIRPFPVLFFVDYPNYVYFLIIFIHIYLWTCFAYLRRNLGLHMAKNPQAIKCLTLPSMTKAKTWLVSLSCRHLNNSHEMNRQQQHYPSEKLEIQFLKNFSLSESLLLKCRKFSLTSSRVWMRKHIS